MRIILNYVSRNVNDSNFRGRLLNVEIRCIEIAEICFGKYLYNLTLWSDVITSMNDFKGISVEKNKVLVE